MTVVDAAVDDDATASRPFEAGLMERSERVLAAVKRRGRRVCISWADQAEITPIQAAAVSEIRGGLMTSENEKQARTVSNRNAFNSDVDDVLGPSSKSDGIGCHPIDRVK